MPSKDVSVLQNFESGLIREKGLCGATDDIQMGVLVAREASTLNDNGPQEEGDRKGPEEKAQTTEAEPGVSI